MNWDYIIGRLSEPSTWVSFGVLTTGIGFEISPEYWQHISAIGMGIGGLMGVILKERGHRTKSQIQDIVKDTVSSHVIRRDA